MNDQDLAAAAPSDDKQSAQEEFWDITERLFYWRGRHEAAATSLRLLDASSPQHVIAAVLARLGEAKTPLDAAFDAYKAFRDAHPGETFVATRPDIASLVDRRRKRRAAITKKRSKQA